MADVDNDTIHQDSEQSIEQDPIQQDYQRLLNNEYKGDVAELLNEIVMQVGVQALEYYGEGFSSHMEIVGTDDQKAVAKVILALNSLRHYSSTIEITLPKSYVTDDIKAPETRIPVNVIFDLNGFYFAEPSVESHDEA